MSMMKLFCGGAGIGVLSLLMSAMGSQAGERIPNENRIGGYAIGCQAYSFNRFSAFEAIEKCAAAGGRVIEFYPGQTLSKDQSDLKVDHNANDDVVQKLKEKLAKHGMMAVNYGVVGLPNDEKECRKVFEFAKKMEIPAVTSEPPPEALDLIEKLVKEYDIKVGIHNHPKRANDPNYKLWDPNYVLSLVKDRDPRIGSASDTGHWIRSDLKPVEALQILKGRIISSHLKDLNQFGPDAHDVPYGTGVANIPGILNELRRQGFEGNISIEYEYNWDNSVPEIAQCIGFVRGYTSQPMRRNMTPAMGRPRPATPAPAAPPAK
jgi:sugar phosphate isomerase/epimerase